MTLLRGGLAVAAALLLAGCGGTSDRQYVAGYIKQVNAIEQQMRVPLNRMVRTYAGFSTKGTKLAELTPRLARAQRTFVTLQRKLHAVQPPPAAKELHRLLLKLVASEIAVAREIGGLATFLPRFAVVVSAVGPADARLARDLAASPTPPPKTVRGTKKQIAALKAEYARRFAEAADAQAAAIEAYRADLAVLAAELRRLSPPAVLRPTYDAELAMLARLRSTGEALVQALRSRRFADVPALNDRFTAAARATGSVTAQTAQIAAIRHYNARIRALNALAVRIQREEARLQRALP